MNISKISTQKSAAFGLEFAPYTSQLMNQTEVYLRKEAQKSKNSSRLDTFHRNVDIMKSISPNKTLLTDKYTEDFAKYSVREPYKGRYRFVEFSVLNDDICFSLLTQKLKKLNEKGVI